MRSAGHLPVDCAFLEAVEGAGALPNSLFSQTLVFGRRKVAVRAILSPVLISDDITVWAWSMPQPINVARVTGQVFSPPCNHVQVLLMRGKLFLTVIHASVRRWPTVSQTGIMLEC